MEVQRPSNRTGDSLVEHISQREKLLAIIVRADFAAPGVSFFTPAEFPLQLASMCHPAGRVVGAHLHNPVVREIREVQEVIFLKRGTLRVDFYDEGQVYQASRVLQAGDVVFLAGGGHGFEALEGVEMLDIKQGPTWGSWIRRDLPGLPEIARHRIDGYRGREG